MKYQAHPRSERAVALIIVLAMLVLLSALIVSFMSSVGDERTASIANTNNVATRQIADSTLNLVISQIREATTQPDTNTTTTWASQPGAIRTFGGVVGAVKANSRNGITGAVKYTYNPSAADKIYKLYSADAMTVGAATFGANAWDPAEINIIKNWSRTTPVKDYVDLNEPILSSVPPSVSTDPNVREPRYPIIDPRAKRLANEAKNDTPNPGIIEGFDIKTNNLYDTSLKQVTVGTSTTFSQPVSYLPMPVKWLYILRDGTVTNAAKATADNPIVGRTAFWVDDESTKLNINTAGEGTFWDTPSVSSEHESGTVDNGANLTSTATSLSLAAAQPSRGEFQRYGGHPATTCLSPVLGWLWNVMPANAPLNTRDTTLLAMKDGIARLSPFIPDRTRGAYGSTSDNGNYNNDPSTPLTGEPHLPTITKHLYPTVDELLFKPDRTVGSTAQVNAPITPEAMEKMRFFLTANSRAPEINLFGRPRVTIWPVNATESNRTRFDNLFAFTSNLYRDPSGTRANDKPFFWTRSDAKSATNDVGPATSQNQRVLKYLKFVTGDGPAAIPGFGGSFASKYTAPERDEILTLCFDYMRTVNLVDTGTSRGGVGTFQPYTPFFGPGTSGYATYANRSNDWSGQVTPTRIAATSTFQGLGRFATITEAAIVFYRTGTIRAADQKQDQLQATLLFEMATPMPGFPALRQTMWTKVKVDRPTFVDVEKTTPLIVNRDIKLVGNVGESVINIVNTASHDVGNGRGFMPTLGFMNQLHYYTEPTGWTDINNPARPVPDASAKTTPKIFEKNASTLAYQRGTTVKYYSYVSDKFPAPAPEVGVANASLAKLKFRGGAYTVEIYSGEAPDDPRSQLVQTVHLNFPATDVAVAAPQGNANADVTFQKRLNGTQDSVWNVFSGYDDLIRSIELTAGATTLNQQGDVRLAMARSDVPDTFFAPRSPTTYFQSGINNDPAQPNRRHHGFTTSHGEPLSGYVPTDVNQRGLLVPGGVNRGAKPAILPIGVTGVRRADGGLGDWDRGISKHMDGAYGGKVDEGNVYFGYNDSAGGRMPYFRGRSIEETGKSFFSPNRQLPSAVMFGSLPTGVVRGKPWQTLLFRPDRGTIPHPGAQSAGSPADHLFLDLFHIPVVEPYAISEPFSTGGKVNMNYVIAPFGYVPGDGGNRVGSAMPRSYVRRDTALRGVLKSVKMMAVPTGQAEAAHAEDPTSVSTPFRFDIDLEKTLDFFEDRLKDPERGLFRSASEICDMDLFPTGYGAPTVSNWATFWETSFAQTGDNMRERPYAMIYPRLTTKSNVYTVHMRCQSIKKVPGTAANDFVPGRDQITGEYRGSAVVERFIDPNDPSLKTYDETQNKVDPYYRFRVVSTKQFIPR